jgi:hypothetical protein
MWDYTLEQFADKLERHLRGTEGKWDWDNFTSLRIRDKRLDRLRCKLSKFDHPVSQTRRAEFEAIIAALRRGEVPEIDRKNST